MNDALKTLNDELSANENRLSIIADEISKLMQQSEEIKENNKHLVYAIDVIKRQAEPSLVRRVRAVETAPEDDPSNAVEKKTLRSAVLDAVKDDESITVGEALERITEQGYTATRAVINSTLHGFVKRGVLVQPEIGRYKKAA